jgi:hypothetical protein
VKRRGEQGVALAITLLVLFVVSLALAILSLSLLVRLRVVRDESQGIVLTALADAALSEAVANLAIHHDFTGLAEHPFGSGRIASDVFPLTPTQFRVRATARLGVRVRAVEAQVSRSDSGVQVTSWRVLPRARGS